MYNDRNASVSVGTSVVVVLPDIYDIPRKSFSITNMGATTISLSIDDEAVSGSGRVLYPGGFWSETKSDEPTSKRITAISSAAGGTLAIAETTGRPD